jgi:hypothetical protein
MGKRTSSRRSSGRWLSKDSKEVKVFVSRGNGKWFDVAEAKST